MYNRNEHWFTYVAQGEYSSVKKGPLLLGVLCSGVLIAKLLLLSSNNNFIVPYKVQKTKKGIKADDDEYITNEFGGSNDHVKSVATA